jgi:hypothetical protein
MEPAGYGLKMRKKEESRNGNIDKGDTKTDRQANKQANKQNLRVVPFSPLFHRRLIKVPTLLSETKKIRENMLGALSMRVWSDCMKRT